MQKAIELAKKHKVDLRFYSDGEVNADCWRVIDPSEDEVIALIKQVVDQRDASKSMEFSVLSDSLLHHAKSVDDLGLYDSDLIESVDEIERLLYQMKLIIKGRKC